MEQNYKNHRRYIPIWHFILPLVIAFILGWGIYNITNKNPAIHMLGEFMVLASIVMLLIWWYARAFALRAQDRAIRAEENFRHYILTCKPLDPHLRMSQVVALRFAPDEEFPILARRAVEEKLSSRNIKEKIQHWKGDYNRV